MSNKLWLLIILEQFCVVSWWVCCLKIIECYRCCAGLDLGDFDRMCGYTSIPAVHLLGVRNMVMGLHKRSCLSHNFLLALIFYFHFYGGRGDTYVKMTCLLPPQKSQEHTHVYDCSPIQIYKSIRIFKYKFRWIIFWLNVQLFQLVITILPWYRYWDLKIAFCGSFTHYFPLWCHNPYLIVLLLADSAGCFWRFDAYMSFCPSGFDSRSVLNVWLFFYKNKAKSQLTKCKEQLNRVPSTSKKQLLNFCIWLSFT